MEVYPSSPRKYPLVEGDPSVVMPEGTARVCVITSVVVCNVDVEPCSVLSQSVVHAGVQPLPPLEAPTKEEDSDVMDRICHDLDYLLGGLPHELKPEPPRSEDSVIDSVMETGHQTTL